MGITAYAQFCETQRGVWPTIEDFLGHVEYVVELAGIDHVAIALDIDEVGYPNEPLHGLTYSSDGWADYNRAYPGLTRPPYDEWAAPNGYPLVHGMEGLFCYPAIAEGLRGRGCSDSEIEKVMGGNWLRVFEEVWGG